MEIKTIAIVGASSLGRRVAYAAMLAGYRTVLEDVSLSALEQGIASIVQSLGDNCARGKIPAAVAKAAFANLSAAISAEGASREADLIIEAVADEMEMKIELFTIFDKFAKPGAIFASTTTSFSITEMAAVTFSPDRCVGMRFFADHRAANRLELVKGRETSEETIAACREIGRRMGIDVFMLGDEPAASANAAG
jgi:3-hydroxybutyryl-CoA dehydrogenase